MRLKIIEKINAELVQGKYTETSITYLLVQIRKIINEHDINLGITYPVLSFFCDWSVHTRLDRSNAKKMLDYFQDFFRGLDSHLEIRKPTNFYPFVMFMVLRRELRLFLKRNNLPINITDDIYQWKAVISCLLGIIMDSPISAKSEYIRVFTIRKSDGLSITCSLDYQDGTKQEFRTIDEEDFVEKQDQYQEWTRQVDKVL